MRAIYLRADKTGDRIRGCLPHDTVLMERMQAFDQQGET